jgi:hypothetical protein
MILEDKIKKLEKRLEDLRESNRTMWDIYGSELSAGALINEEERLEKKIEMLKKEKNEKNKNI